MEKIATVLFTPAGNTHVCPNEDVDYGDWDGELGGFPASFRYAEEFQGNEGDPQMYSLVIYFPGPVETRTHAGAPREGVDHDHARYFNFFDLAGDGSPVGIVAGFMARATKLESGSWELTLWGYDHDVRKQVIADCRGAI